MKKKEEAFEMNKWLISKKLTPAEIDIYKATLYVYLKSYRPAVNGDISLLLKKHRTTVRQQITQAITKGAIKRHTQRSYLPAKVFEV